MKDPGSNGSEAVLAAAYRLLARREHARAELHRKLCDRGHPVAQVDTVVEDLVRQDLLSDERFAESYTRVRTERGFGPARIAAELRQRGIDEELIARHVDFSDSVWREVMQRELHKRFGGEPAAEVRERNRRIRFLQQRGFTMEQIYRVLHADSDEWLT